MKAMKMTGTELPRKLLRTFRSVNANRSKMPIKQNMTGIMVPNGKSQDDMSLRIFM